MKLKIHQHIGNQGVSRNICSVDDGCQEEILAQVVEKIQKRKKAVIRK